MISNPTKWLQQKREGSHATMHPQNTTRRAFSLCCHERHKKTASIHLNVGFYSYCWCPYPQDMRQCSGGLHFAGAWLDLFCTWVNNCFTWDIKHGRVLFHSCTPPLGDSPCELISAIWSRWGHTIDRFWKQPATHCTSQADFMKRCRVLLNLLIQALSVSSNATASAAAAPTSSFTARQHWRALSQHSFLQL